MLFKFFGKILIVMFLVLFVFTIINHFVSAYAFENEFKFPDKVYNYIEETRTIKTTVKYKLYEEEINEDLSGIAIYLGKGYFLALTHVVEHKGSITIPFGFSTFSQLVEIISYEYQIDNYEAELVGKYGDISLFLTKSNKKSCVRFGDSSLLRFEDKLILIGNSDMAGINLKTGIMSRFEMSYEIYKEEAYCSFIVSNPTNGGDSRGMLLAQEGDDYYIVGIIHSYLRQRNGIGVAFKSNYVTGVLKLITQDVNFFGRLNEK